ncbi:hypothetical protein GJU39_17890 [Pedobacter petrophilus]|uniref:Uncharacterized protein n=1 Tax=Pedobacter petrophilus TaxID=1908241 RepID=A0A7K0G2B5_9SPHI|nr:hypothetical protein [Pedobacter petrophilus]MRX77955.1 hypothetical protein [Pedobacter petrophilus]
MKNFVISHFGVFEVDNYLGSDVSKPIVINERENYFNHDGKAQSSLAQKKPFQWFLNLLFRKFF